jgi:membrane-associated phospholipid phosphatase
MTLTSPLGGKASGEGRSLARRLFANLAAWIGVLTRGQRVTVHNPLWPLSRAVALRLLAAVLLIGATMILFDAWAVSAARHLPLWLMRAFDHITDFGKAGWFLWPLCFVLIGLAVAAPVTQRLAQLVIIALALRLSFLFLAIAVPGLFTDIVKRIGRARPFVTGTADPFAFSWFDFRAAYASFPSGHATTAFAAALAFGALWPKLRPFLWAYAAVIAFSRVVVTAHYPSDVAGGAMLGALGAILIRNWFAARRLVFVVAADGRVNALSGPSWQRIKTVVRKALHAKEDAVSPPPV